MAAVLPRNTTELGLFYHESHPSPIVAEPAYGVSHFGHNPSASIAMYDCSLAAYHSGLNPNGISQPSLSSSPNSCMQAMPLYSSPPPPRSESATPLYRPPLPLVSESGMIVVVDYTPSEGEANIPITVNLELHTDGSDHQEILGHNMSLTSMKLRLVFGRTAVKTTVKSLSSTLRLDGEEEPRQRNYMRLRLHANTPSHSEVRFPERFCVPLTIQAMDAATEVVESFTFGTFTYWTPATIRPAATLDLYKFPDLSVPTQNKRKREEDDAGRYPHPPEPESSPTVGSPKKAFAVPPCGDRGFKLVRTTNAPAEALGGGETQTAKLEWVVNDRMHHPNSLDKRWSTHELAVGRRLIRFGREQSGNKLLVSCEVIAQEAYDEDDIVISCVYRQETRNCWFTSVDVIYLLERLVGSPFSVEEKNRIRRNLEGFKPTTVSKSKGGFEMFFQRIMDFPPPKPRNIEKDVKVFPWSVLSQALDKIISKYSVIPRSASDSSPSQESSSLSSSGQVVHTTRASQSGSVSSVAQVQSEGSGFVKPLEPVPSQQSLHLVIESPPMLHSEPMPVIPEPESIPMSMDQFYFSHAQDMSFPDGDHWRRRDSIISPGTASTHTDGYYSEQGPRDPHATPGPLHVHAFSNPFASDVNLGAISLGSHGHTNGLDVSADMNGGTGGNTPANAMRFESSFADDVFASRRSSLASDLLYPGPISDISPNSNHDAIAAAYSAGAQDPHNVPHDLLYAQFSSGSHHHLPLEDVSV